MTTLTANCLATANLSNVRVSGEICNCYIHKGEYLQQIDAQLPNGREIRVLLDSHGYHVTIGNPRIAEYAPCPPPVTQAEAERLLREANR